MIDALNNQTENSELHKLQFDERFGLIVDWEYSRRETVKLEQRLRTTKLRQNACIEYISFKEDRGLERALLAQLSSCKWIQDSLNLLITGPTGIGKSYLACALANKACRASLSVCYFRAPKFLPSLRSGEPRQRDPSGKT